MDFHGFDQDQRRRRAQGSVILASWTYTAGPRPSAFIMAAVFGLLGLAGIICTPLVMGPAGPAGGWSLFGAGVVFLLIAGISLYFAIQMGRPAPAPTDIPDWPRLTGKVEQAFRETPYLVSQTSTGLRIETDVKDPRFRDAPRRGAFAWAPAMSLTTRTENSVYFSARRSPADLGMGPGDWQVHQGTGSMRSVSVRREMTLGGPRTPSTPGAPSQGAGTAEPSGYRFKTSEVTGPAKAAARAAGFRLTRPPHTQMPIVMAGLGVAVAVGVGLALAILGITGNLS
jgi:hypothetical protein